MNRLLSIFGMHIHEWSRVWRCFKGPVKHYQVCVICGQTRTPKVEF